jgi:hypothetical protein
MGYTIAILIAFGFGFVAGRAYQIMRDTYHPR